MQFLNGLVALVFAGVVAALATPSDVTLSDRAEDVVPSHLTRPSTFYRAITADELPHVAANYPIGHPPTRHGTSEGDYTVKGTGGLYVLDNYEEANTFGRCYSRTLKENWPHYYIITLEYTPDPGLRIKSFTEDNAEWATFVKNSYNDIAHPYDIVEGPYSTEVKGEKVGAISDDGKKVWQAAFVGPRALATLRVKEVKKVNTRPPWLEQWA